MADAMLFMPIKPETGLTLETAAEAKTLVLYALIKAASKYAYQGQDQAGKSFALRITHMEESDYAFHLENGNRYRREDLTFYVRNLDGQLIKLR
jgi:hypothetical protein